MTDPEAVWVVAMPEELNEVVGHHDTAFRQAANKGWLVVGFRGREQLREFINSASFDWVRRVRCELTARRLVRAGQAHT